MSTLREAFSANRLAICPDSEYMIQIDLEYMIQIDL
jgi:hypothetical protein